MFLRCNGNLGELRHRGFVASFSVRLGLLQIRKCKGVTFGEDYELDFSEEKCSQLWQGNPRVAVAPYQTN